MSLVRPEDSSAGGETAIEIYVTLEDAALAETLGWTDGVPDVDARWAFVHYRRYLFEDARSDTAGVIRFEPEGRGWHWVAAEKEVVIDGERRVLGGGAKTTGSAGLTLNLDDPGSLVISEVYMEEPPPWEVNGYAGSKYVEIYNNSREVLFLDGKLLGTAYTHSRDTSGYGHHSCSYTELFRADPEAVWSRSHWRFPGAGTDHPVAPGEAVVVAVSAADHTPVHPSMLDLTAARFEFGGGGQADNPAAANMRNISVDYGGLSTFYITEAYWFISDALDVEALEVRVDDDYLFGSVVRYRGFPASAILDVAVIWPDWTSVEVGARDAPPCPDPIHPRFDELPGGYLWEALEISSQRKVVRTEGGRPILQDTNTSAVDFENRERTPGWIPGG